jgi:hypothetical protein
MSKKDQELSNVSPSQIQRDQREAVNKAFDQARNNVKKTVYDAQKDISDYARQFIDMQEKAFAMTGEIADNYIASQKELFNSFNQTIWTPYVENVANRNSVYPGVFSPSRVEVYTNTISNIVEHFVTATRLVNRTVFANAGLVTATLQQVSNNAMEFSRLGVTAAKNVHETSSEIAKIGFSAIKPTAMT